MFQTTACLDFYFMEATVCTECSSVYFRDELYQWQNYDSKKKKKKKRSKRRRRKKKKKSSSFFCESVWLKKKSCPTIRASSAEKDWLVNGDGVPLVEFMYFVFIHMPGESYCSWLSSLLLSLCYVFWALINSLVCWFWFMVSFSPWHICTV